MGELEQPAIFDDRLFVVCELVKINAREFLLRVEPLVIERRIHDDKFVGGEGLFIVVADL